MAARLTHFLCTHCNATVRTAHRGQDLDKLREIHESSCPGQRKKTK